VSQIGAAMPHPSAAASGRLLRIAVASRVAVLVVGYLAVVTSGYQLKSPQYRLSHEELWNLPARWDAGWYLGIARRGYDWRPDLVDRQQSIAFFPAYPLAMRVAGEVVTLPARAVGQPGLLGNGNTRVTWGGVAVSIVAFTLAVVQLHRLITSMTGDAAMASRTVGLLASWPFALFFSAPYAEGLFLLASVSATSEACQKR
jgi:Gpi18-like mannosyltransferase